MKWNTATKEKGDLETEFKLMRKDRDDYKDNFNQVITNHIKQTHLRRFYISLAQCQKGVSE